MISNLIINRVHWKNADHRNPLCSIAQIFVKWRIDLHKNKVEKVDYVSKKQNIYHQEWNFMIESLYNTREH